MGLVALASYFQLTPIDMAVADLIYAMGDKSWVLKDDFIVSGVLYSAGQLASKVAWVGVCIAWIACRFKPGRAGLQSRLARLAVSVLVSVLIVSLMKGTTGVHCPWDIIRYGGDALPGDGAGRCFPAGHASGAYAWLALGFFFQSRRGQRLAIGGAILVGIIFGVAQQLRGAHFLSHDLWAAAICWAVSVSIAALWKLPEGRGA